jgi:hypothetical protein
MDLFSACGRDLTPAQAADLDLIRQCVFAREPSGGHMVEMIQAFYRHTLATRLLGQEGTTFEQVADILGNSPEVVRRHYGKWSKGRQANIDRLMMAHFQTAGVTNPVTRQSHEKTEPVN